MILLPLALSLFFRLLLCRDPLPQLWHRPCQPRPRRAHKPWQTPCPAPQHLLSRLRQAASLLSEQLLSTQLPAQQRLRSRLSQQVLLLVAQTPAQQRLLSRLSQQVVLLLGLLPAQQRLLSRLSQWVVLLSAQLPVQQRLHRRQRKRPRAWRICRRT